MRITRPAALAALLAAVLLLAACAPAGRQAPVQPSETTTVPTPVRPATVRIGNLPTEDLLPLWVAEEKGLLGKAGLNVQIVPFQSAQERDAAFTARSIDGFMGDILAVSELQQAGFKNRIATVCLGATPAEGRFGIVSSPDSKARSLKDLANIPVGTSSGTIQEYMLDGLMKNAGVPADQVKKEEVKKVPVRFELLMNNDIKAAALPEPFLSLADVAFAPRVQRGFPQAQAACAPGFNLSLRVLQIPALRYDRRFRIMPRDHRSPPRRGEPASTHAASARAFWSRGRGRTGGRTHA
jgi:NitT/TauT family transport system substrate-binding protein